MNGQIKQRLDHILSCRDHAYEDILQVLCDCRTALEGQEQALKEAAEIIADAIKLEQRLQKSEAELNTLLFAVARKFPGETRFQTALRYIEEAEKDSVGTTDAAKESK